MQQCARLQTARDGDKQVASTMSSPERTADPTLLLFALGASREYGERMARQEIAGAKRLERTADDLEAAARAWRAGSLD